MVENNLNQYKDNTAAKREYKKKKNRIMKYWHFY